MLRYLLRMLLVSSLYVVGFLIGTESCTRWLGCHFGANTPPPDGYVWIATGVFVLALIPSGAYDIAIRRFQSLPKWAVALGMGIAQSLPLIGVSLYSIGPALFERSWPTLSIVLGAVAGGIGYAWYTDAESTSSNASAAPD